MGTNNISSKDTLKRIKDEGGSPLEENHCKFLSIRACWVGCSSSLCSPVSHSHPLHVGLGISFFLTVTLARETIEKQIPRAPTLSPNHFFYFTWIPHHVVSSVLGHIAFVYLLRMIPQTAWLWCLDPQQLPGAMSSSLPHSHNRHTLGTQCLRVMLSQITVAGSLPACVAV